MNTVIVALAMPCAIACICICIGVYMNREELEKIFDNEDTEWEGDNAFQGLLILNKYAKHDVLVWAGHDQVFSIGIDEALESGLTLDDADKLRKLNWMIDDDCFSCFV